MRGNPSLDVAAYGRMAAPDVLDEYEQHLRRHHRSARTRESYAWALGAFLEANDWQTVDTLTIERWLDTRDLSRASRAWWVSVLRGFYRWAVDRDLLASDRVARALVRPASPDYRPRPAPAADAVMALEMAGGPLRRALALMMWAGLRCCEVAQLRWASVDLPARAMYVEGKGGRTRWVPLHPALVGELLEQGRPGEPVIGVDWAADQVSRRVRAHLRRLGIVMTAHQLRHSFATQGYKGRSDLLAVSRLLGHRNVATTQVYVDVDAERLRATVESIDYGL